MRAELPANFIINHLDIPKARCWNMQNQKESFARVLGREFEP